MGTVKGWKDLDATLVGLVFLQALLNLEKGCAGWVEVDLGDRWIRIVVDPGSLHLVVSPISVPSRVREDGEKG